MNKTKKALLAAVACAAAFAGAFGLAACNNGDGHSHVWSEWTVENANKPTESAPGKATRTCTVDGCTVEADEHTLPPLDETNYVKGEDSATCVEGGEVTYTYDKEGVNVSFTVNTQQKTEHTWGEWTVENANKPTDSAPGKATRTCTVDGCTVEADEHTLPPLDETNYVKGEDSATCVEGGEVTYTYDKEGVNVSFTVNTQQKTEHTWGEWTVEKENEPTAEKDGKATKTCTVSGCTVEAQEHVLPALNETDYVKSADSATCMAGGTITYTYNKDGINKVFTVETPVNPTAHGTLEHHEARFISCELGGNVEYWDCPLCEKKFDAEESGNELTDVTTPAGHSYEIVTDKANGTATESCANDGCDSTKTYKFIDNDNAGTQTAPTAITLGDYYLENLATSNLMWFKLELTEAAVYKLDFEHLVATSVGSITLVSLDGATNVASGRGGTIVSGFANVASHSRVAGNNNQSASFTFDATNYTGHYLLIQLSVQRQPKIKMSVSKGTVPLKVGTNSINITEAFAVANVVRTFIPEETKEYSITVPAGLTVDLGETPLGEGGAFNFNGTEGEALTFSFTGNAVGAFNITIGDAVKLPTITTTEPLTSLSFNARAATVFEVGDIEEGKYTLAITVPQNILRGAVICFGKGTSTDYNDYFASNGDYSKGVAEAYFQAPQTGTMNGAEYEVTSANNVWSITLDLKKGDQLVLVSGATTNAVLNITLTKV